jgi:hypothetical protein
MVATIFLVFWGIHVDSNLQMAKIQPIIIGHQAQANYSGIIILSSFLDDTLCIEIFHICTKV